LAGQQARILILSGADFASQSQLVHSRWYSPHGEHIPKPPENDVIHNIILGIACFVLGWITQALFAGRRERENDDILLNEINRSRKKYYESGFAAGSKDAMDVFDQCVVEMNTEAKGEKEMNDLEPGQVPAEDKGVMYSRRGGDPENNVEWYLCSECAKVEYFSLIRVSAASPQVLREELLDHAREHGYSHCTIEDERSVWPEVTSPALFKRVTMIRNQEGMHYYECSDCLHVCNQNALDDHAKHIHAIEDHSYTIDYEPTADAWRPGMEQQAISSLPAEGKRVPVVDYSSGVGKVVGEGMVFPDGRVSSVLHNPPEFLKDVIRPLSFGFDNLPPGVPTPLKKDLFKSTQEKLGRVKMPPNITFKTEEEKSLDEIVDETPMQKLINGIVSSATELLESLMPDDFTGKVVSTSGIDEVTYTLVDQDGNPVAFKDGNFEVVL
jgi:hypothetical protein